MKTKFSLLAAGVAAIVLASCAKEQVKEPDYKGGRTIYFNALVDEPTKASLVDQGNSYFKGGWEDGDKLAVCAEGYHIPAVWNGTAFQSDDISIYGGEEVVGYYPYVQTEENAEIHFPFSGSNREQIGNHYASEYDVMYSEPVTIEEGQTKVTINMIRATAIQYFKFTTEAAGVKDEKIVSATLTVTGADANIAASDYATIVTTGEGEAKVTKLVANTGENSITLTFPQENAPTAAAFQLWFNVCPVAYETLSIHVETTGHEFTVTNSTPGSYAPGKLYNVAAAISAGKWTVKQEPAGDKYVKVTSSVDDWSGNYLFVYSNETTNYAFNSSLETLDAAKNYKEVSVSNNEIAFDENTAAINVVIAKMESGNYSIKAANGQYIGHTGNDNKLATSDEPIESTISFDKVVIIKNPENNCQLKFNSATDNLRFRYFKSGQQTIDVYKLNGRYAPTFPVLNVSDASYASNAVNVSVAVTSNRDWTASITEGSNNVENGALTTSSGSGDGNITFRFNGSNTSAISNRTVKINVVAGENEKEVNITVTQKALQASLTLTASVSEVEASATEYTFNVEANFPEWSVLSYTIGSESQTVTSENCVVTKEGNNGTVTVKFPSNAAQEGYETSARNITIEVGYTDVITKSALFTQKGDAQEATSGWILTDISNIASTDKFVIVSGGYALSSANGDNSSPAAVSVTITGNKITTDITDALKWTISGDATNGYSLYANGDAAKKLYVNTTAASSSNTSMRVGSGTSTGRYIFTLEGSNYKTFKTKDNYTARYLNLYSASNDWRSYVANSTNTDLKFYKFVDSRTPQTGFGYNASESTYDLKDNTWSTTSAPALSGALTTVSYKSSNTSVATVSNDGTVSIVAVGTTTITASTAEDDPTYQPATSSYTLKVVNTTPVLTLNKTSVNVSAAAAENATIESAYALSSAQDTDVTVGFDGNITAASISEGTVTYTISANETSSTVDSHIKLTLNGNTQSITVTQAAAGKTPMVAPSKPSVTAYTTTGVTASWTAPASGPAVTSYDWLISTSDNIEAALSNVAYSGNVTTTTFTKSGSFTASTTYYVYVRSKGDDASTDPSSYVRSDSFTIKGSTTYSCTFNSKSWAVADGGTISWTSDKDAYQYSSPNVQVTSAYTGAGATTTTSYSNITKVRIKASTTTKGVGNITVKVGTGDAQQICSLSKNTTATFYELTFSTPVSGKVAFIVNCSTNSMYVQGVEIIADAQ